MIFNYLCSCSWKFLSLYYYHTGHSMSNQHKKPHPLWISLKFNESKAPIEKLNHINFWPHSSIILGLWSLESQFFDDFSYALALITGVSCITEVWLWHHFEAPSMPYQKLCNTIMILKVKENSSRAYPVIFTISKTDSFNFLIFSLKVSLMKLLYFPKFQRGTEMRSRDISEKVAKEPEKVIETEVVNFKDP